MNSKPLAASLRFSIIALLACLMIAGFADDRANRADAKTASGRFCGPDEGQPCEVCGG
jgi:hypothetical protein